jgi:hypothetical protein
MPAHAVHHPRSGRFVKAYLLTWGLMATGALAYLGSLAWQPEMLATPPPSSQVAEAEPDPVLVTASKALAEIGSVRRSVGEIQRDVRQLKETVQQHEAQGKVVQTRLATLEERAAQEAPIVAAATATATKAADKVRGKAHIRTAEPRPTGRVVTTIEGPRPPNEAEPAPIETGSIANVPITFGDAVVTAAPGSAAVTMVATPAPAPAAPTAAGAPSKFAVQLGAGPSLDALRLSWGMLVERHGAALASLHPHVVPPRNSGGPYKLVAGPLPSKADADKVCSEMGLGRNNCFSTTFAGEPL